MTTENIDLELVLGLSMYRMDLSDTNAHSDEWPDGMTSNLGELDFQAEMIIRALWAIISREDQRKLLNKASRAVMEAIKSATLAKGKEDDQEKE